MRTIAGIVVLVGSACSEVPPRPGAAPGGEDAFAQVATTTDGQVFDSTVVCSGCDITVRWDDYVVDYFGKSVDRSQVWSVDYRYCSASATEILDDPTQPLDRDCPDGTGLGDGTASDYDVGSGARGLTGQVVVPASSAPPETQSIKLTVQYLDRAYTPDIDLMLHWAVEVAELDANSINDRLDIE